MPEPSAPAERIDAWRTRSDHILEQALSAHTAADPRLHAAMRHAVLLGGKRMRPLLVYATGSAFGADIAKLDAPAAAVELVHAYSLVHDDLPAMDDDALRRGQPTVHVAFDEAIAILAGDALQSLAFAVLADADSDATTRVAMLQELAIAAGARGMCGGQALDLAATGKKKGGQKKKGKKGGQSHFSAAAAESSGDRDPKSDSDPLFSRDPKSDSDPLFSPADLERLHALKTGALLRAAVRLGAIAADVDTADRARLDDFADALGLAFQIRDDLLDVEGDSATLGKTAGKDAAQAKATFPSLLGVDASRRRLDALAGTMRDALAPFGDRVDALLALGRQVIERSH